MTGFVLKIIAVITMVLDHIKYAVPATDCFLTRYFGRIAFPIFAFLVTEGWVHTSNKKKYCLRMFIFACISQLPFMLFRSLVADKFLLNIMFTFLFGFGAIFFIEYFRKLEALPKILRFICIFIAVDLIALIGFLIPVDYNWFGIMTVVFFYIFRENKILRTVMYCLLVITYYLSNYAYDISQLNVLSVIFTMLPSFIILFYNGKEGKKIKYFFYFFYPVHQLIIYCLSLIFI